MARSKAVPVGACSLSSAQQLPVRSSAKAEADAPEKTTTPSTNALFDVTLASRQLATYRAQIPPLTAEI